MSILCLNYVQILSNFCLNLSKFLSNFKTSVLSGFETSLMPCLEKHHSTAMPFVLWSGRSRGRLYSGVWTAHAHLLLYVEFGPLPQPNQASADYIFLHTGSMTVTRHVRKAPAPGVAQFDTSPRRILYEWGQRTQHTGSFRWRVPGTSRNWLPPVKKVIFVDPHAKISAGIRWAHKHQVLLVYPPTSLVGKRM